jgi:hypothetical protein
MMSMEKSRLDELSKALPEKERKELLERIGRRMEQEEGEDPVPVELQQDERDKIISYELKKASAWIRFNLWLRTLVSGRPRRDVFLDIRLRLLKNHIRSQSPGMTGFETRDLSARFARKLYDLYLKVQAVAGIYHALASDRAVRGAAYAWYVDQRWEHAKKGIDEFIRTEEMEEIFAQTGQTDEIKKKLSLRLNDYVHTIPESFLLQLEEEARLHLSLGRLVAFPYATFFRYFNFLLADSADPRAPSFEPAPVMLTLDLMEKLHVTFGLFHHNAPDYLYAEEPIACYLALRSGVKPGGEPAETRDEELGKLRADIMAIAQEIDDFEVAIPLLDLLRYFRRDPWFQLVVNAPRLYLRSMYFSTLKTRLGQELEERLSDVKERVIGRKIQDVL